MSKKFEFEEALRKTKILGTQQLVVSKGFLKELEGFLDEIRKVLGGEKS